MKHLLKKNRIAVLLTVILLFVAVPFPAAASNGGGSLVFTEDEISVVAGSTASGYTAEGTQLTINSPGTYILQGSCANGSVEVKKGTTGVRLILNGLDLTAGGTEASATGALVCNKSTEVTIEAAEGTVNCLKDSIYNNDDLYNNDAENAVIKCKDGSQVTICGTGELNITANGKNGIKSGATTEKEGTAWLVVKELDLNITVAESGNDAINAEQLLQIPSGKLTISAVDDAIHSDLELEIGADGVAGPEITITDCYEGIEAANLSIYSGEISVTSEDDCMNAANSDISEEYPDYPFSLGIYGGNLFLYSTDGDGIDSNGSLDLKGGTVEVWTANTADNQPLDSDGTLTVKGGTVFAAGGSSGAEGLNLSSDSQTYITFGGNAGGQTGQQPDGEATPSEKPDGEDPDGQNGQQPDGEATPSEKPNEEDPDGQTGQQPDGEATPSEKPDGEDSDGQTGQQPDDGEIPPEKPDGEDSGGQTGQQPRSGSGAGITVGMTISVTQSQGIAVYTAQEAPCNADYVFFSSPELRTEETYTLSTGTSGRDTSEREDTPDGEDDNEEDEIEDPSSENNSESSDSSSDRSSNSSSGRSSSGSTSSSGGSGGGGASSFGTTSADTVTTPAGTLEDGTWEMSENGRIYLLKNGTKAAGGWYPIKIPYAAASQNSWGWFYFDKEGIMKTGWMDDEDGNRYYLSTDSDGQMGAALLGWQKLDGAWYYFSMSTGSEHPTGSLYRNQNTPDGCAVDSDGKWIENS